MYRLRRRRVEGEGRAQGLHVRVRVGGSDGLSLELHSDLDEVERVSRTSGDDGGDSSFDESFDSHVVLLFSDDQKADQLEEGEEVSLETRRWERRAKAMEEE